MTQERTNSFNPFANVDRQSTKPEDYNFTKSFISDAGGMIKAYQEKEEDNKLSNFNNALNNFQMDGDTAGLKQLANYADQFTDAAKREKARTAAVGAHDVVGMANLNNIFETVKRTGDVNLLNGVDTKSFFDPNKSVAATKALGDTADSVLSSSILGTVEQLKQAGNATGVQSIYDNLAGTGMSPAKVQEVTKSISPILPELKIQGQIQDQFQNVLGKRTAANEANKTAFTKAFAETPDVANYFENINGQLVERDSTSQQAIADAILKKTPGMTLDALRAATTAELTRVNAAKDIASKNYYANASKYGATSFEDNNDQAVNDVKAKLISGGVSVAKANEAGQQLSATLQLQKQLGDDGKAEVAKRLGPVMAQIAAKKEVLRQEHAIDQKLSDADIQEIIDQKKFGVDDVFKQLSEVDPTGNWLSPTQNNRASVTEKVQSLLKEKIDLGNNVKREPTLFEVAQAIKLSKDSPWWTSFVGNRSTLNTSDLLPNIKLAMQNNGAFNKTPITEEVFKKIKTYVTANAALDTQALTANASITRRVMADSGQLDNPFNRDRLKEAATAAATTKPTTSPTSENFIKKEEGFKGTAYSDGNGVSAGYGHQITTAEKKAGFIDLGNGETVPVVGANGEKTVLTEQQANKLYQQDFTKHETIAKEALGDNVWNKLNENQKTAVTSYAFNVGSLNKEMKTHLENGDTAKAAELIRNGVRTSKGVENATLVARRNREADLFLSGAAPKENVSIPEAIAKITPTSNVQSTKTSEPAIVKKPTTQYGVNVLRDIARSLPNLPNKRAEQIPSDGPKVETPVLNAQETVEARKRIADAIANLKMKDARAKSTAHTSLIDDLTELRYDKKIDIVKFNKLLQSYSS
jgi:GH24 family phage-related lysozyme (muramidase)